MFPPFPQKRAFELCKKIVSLLNSKDIQIVSLGQQSEERKNNGIMIGVMVCLKKDSAQEVCLVTLSGISHVMSFSDSVQSGFVYVPPVVSPEQINKALEKNDKRIHDLTEKINLLKNECHSREQKDLLTKERKLLTDESLANVHALYSFHCADGSVQSLSSICKKRNAGKLPPTGTGECCAPKLLNFAFSRELVPVSLCEAFYKNGITEENIIPSPPCDERCGIIIPAMLGVEILYRDEHIIVVNKQSGLLSVPGRGPDKQDCIVSRVRRLFPSCIEQPAVHRLDMETSGILVLAFTKEAHRNMNRQFEDGTVSKQYEALLDGVLIRYGMKFTVKKP